MNNSTLTLNKVLLDDQQIEMLIDAIDKYTSLLDKGSCRLAIADYKDLRDELTCQVFNQQRGE